MTELNAPGRIWATVNGMSTRLPDGNRQLVGGWSQDKDRERAVEYIRSDLVGHTSDNAPSAELGTPIIDLAPALKQFGLDATDLDMLKRGDMLGSAGAKFFRALVTLVASRSAEAATEIRAAQSMQPTAISHAQARSAGFTGSVCSDCGSLQMVRSGTCERCQSCGSTTGCS